MRRRRRLQRTILTVALSAAAALLGVTAPAPARADPPPPSLLEVPRARQGYYLGMGLLGMADLNREAGKSLGTWGGFDLTIRFGQLLTRRFGVGLDLGIGSARHQTERAAVINLGLGAQWEVWTNLSVQAGIGIGIVNVTDTANPNASLRGTYGTGYLLAMQYDWFPPHRRRSGGLAISPKIAARFIPEGNGGTFSALAFELGAEVLWWTGLPRNQLELPEGEAYEK